jgi:hypothetical protein
MEALQRPSPTIPIMLDRERHLRMDLWAGFQAEHKLAELYGKKPEDVSILADFGNDRLTMTHVLVLLWAALRHEEPTLTLEQVGHLAQLSDLVRVRDAVIEAWNADYAGQANGQPAPAAAADAPLADSTGVTSGAADAST